MWAALAASGSLGALPDGTNPGGWRLVRHFDFDEQASGNVEQMPRHWYAIGQRPDTINSNFMTQPLHRALVGRSGFPAYSQVGFDSSQHISGRTSFRLGVAGGSAGAFLEVGAVPAVPGSDYQIAAWVRRDNLRRARVRMTAYLIDGEGRLIESSRAWAEPPPVNDRWQRIAVRVLGDDEQAAWLGLTLEVDQPEALADSPLGDQQVVYREVQGGAWFDDIMIWQVPRLIVATQSPVNVIRDPDRPRLSLEVRDMAAQRLMAQVRVFDAEGRLAASMDRWFGDGSPANWLWQPTLDRFGWYVLDMAVYETAETDEADRPSPGQALDRTLSALLWLPAQPSQVGGQMTGLALDGESAAAEQLSLAPQLLEALGLRSVVASCWDPQTTLADLDQRLAALDPLIDRTAKGGRQVTLSLGPLPSELVRAVGADDQSALWLLSQPTQTWEAYLAPVMMRHGQRVRRWQMGCPLRSQTAFDRDLPRQLAAARAALAQLAPEPLIVLPWQLVYDRRGDVAAGAAYILDVPPAILPQQLGEYLESWRAGGDDLSALTLLLRSGSAAELSQDRRIADLALRMLHAWEAGAHQLTLARPWTVTANRPTQLVPDPLTGAFTTVGQRLAGRRMIGRLPLGPGLQAMIFDGPQGGLLAAWNESAGPDEAQLDLYLGPAPVATDVWGNGLPLQLVDGRHRVSLSTTPLFIEPIDAPLAAFRAAFQIEPTLIESTQKPQQRLIHLSNPWPQSISGTLILLGPQSWQFQPSRFNFTIEGGGSVTLPVVVKAPVSEVVGRKQVRARLTVSVGREYTIDATTPVEVGLPGLDFDAQLTLENGENGQIDAVVTQVITNLGSQTLSLYAYASLPQFPRQEQSVAQLQPGESMIRSFRFPQAGDVLRKHGIRVGVREINGPAGLNMILADR